jgi:hypothetical protein
MSDPISNDYPTTNQTSEVNIMNTTISNSPSFDINAYRITQTYGEALGSKKLITIVSVGKPAKGRFFRSSRDPGNTVDVYVLEDKVESSYHPRQPGSSYNTPPCRRPCKQPIFNSRSLSI